MINLLFLNVKAAVWFSWVCSCDPWPLVDRVCYERCPYHPTAATFILSAMWHGAYPGYYLTFLTGIVVTLAARAVSLPANRYQLINLHLVQLPDGMLCSLRSDTTSGHTSCGHPPTSWSMTWSRGRPLRSLFATQWCLLSCYPLVRLWSFTGQ